MRRQCTTREEAALIFLATVLCGCSARPKNFDNENDALRRELMEARRALASAEAERSELRAKLSEAVRARDAATGPSADIVAAMPRCAGIRLGRFTGPARAESPGAPAAVDVLVETFDARDRFVQVAGTLSVDITRIPAGGTPKPELVGSAMLSPPDLREAYRSSFMGTHYAVRVPLRADIDPGKGTLVVRAVLNDGVTGQTYMVTRAVQAPE